jgi:aldehyde:ferredoxin oxidoreductase
MFIFGPGNILSYEAIVQMVNAATGFDYTFEDLMRIGENAIQLQRTLYIDFGGRDEDLLPYLEAEIPAGPTRGNKIDRDDFAKAREHYYRLWGWDGEGRPPKVPTESS